MATNDQTLRPVRLMLRCFAQRHDGLWVAYCLDFALGAQGDTFAEARAKLDLQIRDYVHDVLVGDEQNFAGQLLRRRAPWGYYLRYWFYRWLGRDSSSRPGDPGAGRAFKEPMPLEPAFARI